MSKTFQQVIEGLKPLLANAPKLPWKCDPEFEDWISNEDGDIVEITVVRDVALDPHPLRGRRERAESQELQSW